MSNSFKNEVFFEIPNLEVGALGTPENFDEIKIYKKSGFQNFIKIIYHREVSDGNYRCYRILVNLCFSRFFKKFVNLISKRNFLKKTFKLSVFIISSIFLPFAIYKNKRNTKFKKIYKKQFAKIWILKADDN